MSSALDKLALVSKLLLDRQVLALRAENEDLRLQLFWRDHAVDKLNALMGTANQNGANAPHCVCNGCSCGRRLFPDYIFLFPAPYDERPCEFQPWFERLLTEQGLTVSDTLDAHFMHVQTEFPRPWVTWGYGQRLLSAKSVRDAELQKLHALFEVLAKEAKTHRDSVLRAG